eukprot:8539278-Pyramimonas_sp.AAC.1
MDLMASAEVSRVTTRRFWKRLAPSSRCVIFAEPERDLNSAKKVALTSAAAAPSSDLRRSRTSSASHALSLPLSRPPSPAPARKPLRRVAQVFVEAPRIAERVLAELAPQKPIMARLLHLVAAVAHRRAVDILDRALATLETQHQDIRVLGGGVLQQVTEDLRQQGPVVLGEARAVQVGAWDISAE